MTRMLTASGLWRHFLCVGSAVLERAGETNEWAERGTGLHDFLLAVHLIGRPAALARIEDESLRAACELLNTNRLPVDPKLFAAEVAFAFDATTGRARELGRAIGRDYVGHGARPEDICGTADVVALVGTDTVYVADYKSGWKHIAAPAANWQFRFLALAAARAYKRDRAIVELVRLGKDGEPFKVGGTLDLFDLAETAEKLRELHADQARHAAADADPPCVTGSHCAGCESVKFCKAQMALVHSSVTTPTATIVGFATELLTHEHELEALGHADALENLAKLYREAVDNYASVHPIRMADGRIYGPVDKSRSSPEGAQVWHLLKEKGLTDEEAWKAVKLTSTWTAISDLARRLAAKDGRKITHVEKELRDELYARKAVKSSFFQSVCAHRPKGGDL